jgi:hypothetical protein
MLITLAARSKVRNVFNRSNIWISFKAYMIFRSSSVFVLCCVYSGIAMCPSFNQGVL